MRKWTVVQGRRYLVSSGATLKYQANSGLVMVTTQMRALPHVHVCRRQVMNGQQFYQSSGQRRYVFHRLNEETHTSFRSFISNVFAKLARIKLAKLQNEAKQRNSLPANPESYGLDFSSLFMGAVLLEA